MNEFLYSIYELLVSFLGASKREYSEGVYQYQFPCIRCIENKGERERNKYNLEINILKMKFQCWSCGQYDDEMKGNLTKLFKLYAPKNVYDKFFEIIKNFKQSKLYELHFKNNNSLDLDDSLFDTSLSLPSSFVPITKNDYKSKTALEYLSKRGVGWDIIEKYNIGYTNFDSKQKNLSYRIIIPSYDEYGYVNYWTGRDYIGKSKQKYFNPKVERKDIIFNENKIQWDADITLVEGPFDHIVVPNSIPLLGKALNQDFKLFKKIMTCANANVNIFLDNDAFNDIKTVYRLLNQGRLYGKIRYIESNKDKDPSDIYKHEGKKGIINVLKQAKQMNELMLI